MKSFFNYLGSFISSMLEFIIFYAFLAFIEWDWDITKWSSLSRLAYIILVILSVAKNDEK